MALAPRGVGRTGRALAPGEGPQPYPPPRRRTQPLPAGRPLTRGPCQERQSLQAERPSAGRPVAGRTCRPPRRTRLGGPSCRGGDRKSVVSGKRVSGRVDLGGRRISKNKKEKYISYT